MEFAAAALESIATTAGSVASSVGTAIGSIGAATPALAPLTLEGVQGAVAGTAGAAGVIGAETIAAAAPAAAVAGGGLFSGGLSTLGSLAMIAGGGASLVSSILSGSATAASALATEKAGEEKAQALELSAEDEQVNTGVEVVQGAERERTIKAALLKTIGERDVATAASGVDLTFGTPVQARKEAVRDAENALSINQSTTAFNVNRLNERSANFKLLAQQARSGALAKSAALSLEGAARLFRRG